MRCWVCDQQFSILQWSSAPAERQDFLWLMMFMKQQEMLWKIQALEDFLNKAFAAAKEELGQPMQMITLCHFDYWHHAAFLLNFNACHQFTYHVQFQSRSIAWVHCMGPLHGSIAWVHCMGPLHGSIAWVHCIRNSLTKSWWKSLKCSLRWAGTD